MKRQGSETGSLLIESLVGLNIMSLIIILMVPPLVQMFDKIHHLQKEVEVWRYFQDSAEIQKTGEPVPSRTSDGYRLEWQRTGAGHQVVISYPGGTEVLYVEILP